MIEYKNISRIIRKNKLLFTNIKRRNNKLKKYGKVIKDSVKYQKLENACILDPQAKKQLTKEEAKNFNYFIFGGILGNAPPEKRTKKELTKFIKNAKARNIGKEQLSTDSAVFVVNEIIKGKKLENIKFQDSIEIKINDIESVILPFRYPIINGKPFMSNELVRYLKSKRRIF